MRAALDVLCQFQGRKVAILGDMRGVRGDLEKNYTLTWETMPKYMG